MKRDEEKPRSGSEEEEGVKGGKEEGVYQAGGGQEAGVKREAKRE